MKFLFVLFFTLFYNEIISEEKIFSIKAATNIYMKPDINSPVIYPVDHSKELVEKRIDNWINVLDEKTGLVGWVLLKISKDMPVKKISSKDYDKSFKIFKARVLEYKSIKEAISIEPLDVRHLGGAAAIIVADDNWFKGRRHANQDFKFMSYGK